MRRTVAAVTLALVFLAATLPVSLFPAKAEPRTILVPDDYPTMTAATGNATDGDTIFVRKGTYEEQTLTINKTIALIGEGSSITVINLHPPWVPTGGYHLNGTSVEPYYDWDNPIKIEADYSRILGFTARALLA